MDTSQPWIPRLAPSSGSRYLAIVNALAADIAAGTVAQGTRLLPQRDMAEQLGLSVGTVAKAYAEASRRGLLSGEVGRGTFVCGRADAPHIDGRPLDMTLNAPPSTGEDALIAAGIAKLAATALAPLLGYLPHAGLPAQRAPLAAWVAEQFRVTLPPERMLLCNGAQHAIAVALMAALAPGEPLLAEAASYPGLFGLARMLGHPLHGVAMDAEGMVPEALDTALEHTGTRMVYCMPTLQTPTGATMSAARRQAVIAVLRRHGALALEDDVYGFLLTDGPPPLAASAPDLVCYVTSLAKCAAPGLRVGMLALPEPLRDRGAASLRATGWMTSPLLGGLVAQMVADGSLSTLVARKRVAATERWRIARQVLGEHAVGIGAPASFHLWLPLQRPAAEVIAEVAMQGIVLAPPAQVPGADQVNGIRLCLGAPDRPADLRSALIKVAAVLRGLESRSHV
jgi:DNA-binding transcriptional MocR family regulator